MIISRLNISDAFLDDCRGIFYENVVEEMWLVAEAILAFMKWNKRRQKEEPKNRKRGGRNSVGIEKLFSAAQVGSRDANVKKA